MSVLKVHRSSSVLLKSNCALPSIFEFITQTTASFRYPKRKCSAASAKLIILPRIHSKAPSAACLQQQNRKCSSARLLTSPYRDIRAPCDSLVDFIWKDVNKWSSHTAIVRFNFCFYKTIKKCFEVIYILKNFPFVIRIFLVSVIKSYYV